MIAVRPGYRWIEKLLNQPELIDLRKTGTRKEDENDEW
jgi:hypothetical protein